MNKKSKVEIPGLTSEQLRAAKIVAGLFGAIGGRGGTGKAKRRTKAHYRAAGLKSGASRRAAKLANETPAFPPEQWRVVKGATKG